MKDEDDEVVTPSLSSGVADDESECRPLVSVITPFYNGEDYLAEALQSVIDQTYR